MKTRTGFVSNSSTTSFTCEVCGETASGWDIGYEEMGFFSCMNDHVLCEEHKLDAPDLTNQEMYDIIVEYYKGWSSQIDRIRALDPDGEEIADYWDEVVCDSGIAERYCPICQFYDISTPDTAAFLLKEVGIPREEVFATVKALNKRRKKLYDSEYIMFTTQKTGMDITRLPTVLKERFGTYRKFQEWLREK